MKRPAHAKCDICPLKDVGIPVLGNNLHKSITIVGDFPDKRDVEYKTPLVGETGSLLSRWLEKLGLSLSSVGATYAVKCRYPQGKKKEFLGKLKSINFTARRRGEAPRPLPSQCCRPALLEELKGKKNIITLGDGLKAILQHDSVDDRRGGPIAHTDGRPAEWGQTGEGWLIPTMAPYRAQREPKYEWVIMKDLAKAVRFFKGKQKTEPRNVVKEPTAGVFRQLINNALEAKPIVYADVETDGIDAREANMESIAFTFPKTSLLDSTPLSIGLPWRWEDKKKFTKAMWVEVARLLNMKDVVKVFHNLAFDWFVIRKEFQVEMVNNDDTIIWGFLAYTEHRRSLDFLSSILTDEPAWKAEHRAQESKDEYESLSYNIEDTYNTYKIHEPLVKQAQARNQDKLLYTTRELQTAAMGMKELGLLVDDTVRRNHVSVYEKKMRESLKILQSYQKGLNPASVSQLKKLIFDDWNYSPVKYTDAAQPSTDEESILTLMLKPTTSPEHKEFFKQLRAYRGSNKILTSYLYPLVKGDMLNDDGIWHHDFNTTGTVSGRYSSRSQIFPKEIRDVFVPRKGMVFVYADQNQLELRMASALAGAKFYLDEFKLQRMDMHNSSMELMLGKDVWKLPGAPTNKMKKGEGKFGELRDLIKRLVFLIIYKGEAPMALSVLKEIEDENGNFPYAHRKVSEIRKMRQDWLQGVPEFEQWWLDVVESCQNLGYVEDKVLGRRRYFHPNETEENEKINFGVQAGGRGVVIIGIIRLLNLIPFNYKKGIGFVHDGHDSVCFQVPEDTAESTKTTFKEQLVVNIPGLDVEFSAEPKILRSMKVD